MTKYMNTPIEYRYYVATFQKEGEPAMVYRTKDYGRTEQTVMTENFPKDMDQAVWTETKSVPSKLTFYDPESFWDRWPTGHIYASFQEFADKHNLIYDGRSSDDHEIALFYRKGDKDFTKKQLKALRSFNPDFTIDSTKFETEHGDKFSYFVHVDRFA